jgi:hypothetical protein
MLHEHDQRIEGLRREVDFCPVAGQAAIRRIEEKVREAIQMRLVVSRLL